MDRVNSAAKECLFGEYQRFILVNVFERRKLGGCDN